MGNKVPNVLSIAGSDSSGGAGIQADLKTFSALGCYGTTVITALTAQNTLGVADIHAVPAVFVEKQLEAVLSDIGADAVKIGMLYSAEIIKVVESQLRKHKIKNIVLDTIITSQSGTRLLKEDALEEIKALLMPLADVITPNLPEASFLLGHDLKNIKEMQEGAKKLAQKSSSSILIKGGHINGNVCTDVLYLGKEDRIVLLKEDRIETTNNHGTGCTLSSAIASHLACGDGIENAVKKAKKYISEAIRAGVCYNVGKGNGPVRHFYR